VHINTTPSYTKHHRLPNEVPKSSSSRRF